MKLPAWMRLVMLAAAALNLVGAVTFMPRAQALRLMGGFPVLAHPFYLSTIGVFILVFGLVYLWAGVTGKADRQFVAVGAAGKLAFCGLIVRYWWAGLLPTTAVTSGIGDLVIGILFLVWLVSVYGAAHDDGGEATRQREAPPN